MVNLSASDGDQMPLHSRGQSWLLSWHRPDDVPQGRPHGVAGVCVNSGGDLVLISRDGRRWELPAGRPEGDETGEETLRREMREEACVEVVKSRLLGYARSECVAGEENGLVLVRSFWRADVRIGAWEPSFEIDHRRILRGVGTLDLGDPDEATARVNARALIESDLDPIDL